MTSPHFRECSSYIFWQETHGLKKTWSISSSTPPRNGLRGCYCCWPTLEKQAERSQFSRWQRPTIRNPRQPDYRSLGGPGHRLSKRPPGFARGARQRHPIGKPHHVARWVEAAATLPLSQKRMLPSHCRVPRSEWRLS